MPFMATFVLRKDQLQHIAEIAAIDFGQIFERIEPLFTALVFTVIRIIPVEFVEVQSEEFWNTR